MEPEKIFAQRFTELVNNSDYTLEEIGEHIGIKSKSTVSKYLSGDIKNVKSSIIANIADLFNVSPAWLAGLSDEKYRETKLDKYGRNVISIPLIGTVRAGYNYLAEQNWEGTRDIPKELAKTGDFFALRINGNSMFETLWDSDIVAVKKQNYAVDGNIAVVLINGDEATVKMFRKLDNGIKLMPLNRRINSETNEPYYEDLFFTEKEIETKPVQIIGIVKQIIERNFN